MAKIENNGKQIDINDGESIISACEELGVLFACQQGNCEICKIEILDGENNLSELTESEQVMEMDKTNRLACQCKIKQGLVKIKF
tara:strand:+ start:1686 stop:1940 length:255 start_codon:yes stop_codon:yes gene_type:complete